MSALPLNLAAAELGVSVPTLRRWLRQGAPVAHRGRRGRGGRALVDVRAVRAWLGSSEAGAHRDLEVLAAELPELVAGAVAESFARLENVNKRQVAGVLAGTWLLVVYALLDRIRRDVPGLPDPSVLPEKIVHLRSINGDLGTTASGSNTRRVFSEWT